MDCRDFNIRGYFGQKNVHSHVLIYYITNSLAKNIIIHKFEFSFLRFIVITHSSPKCFVTEREDKV